MSPQPSLFDDGAAAVPAPPPAAPARTRPRSTPTDDSWGFDHWWALWRNPPPARRTERA